MRNAPAYEIRNLHKTYRAPEVVANEGIYASDASDVSDAGADGLLTPLVDAPCAAKALTCRYHGWTYDFEGALLRAPRPRRTRI